MLHRVYKASLFYFSAGTSTLSLSFMIHDVTIYSTVLDVALVQLSQQRSDNTHKSGVQVQ